MSGQSSTNYLDFPEKSNETARTMDGWRSTRRLSVNLLDMSDSPSLQPNVTNQQLLDQYSANNTNNHEISLLDKSLEEIKNESKEPLGTSSSSSSSPSLYKLDLLQQKPPALVVDTTEAKPKVMPTRLPTPRKPVNSSHLSADALLVSSPAVHQNPTPPSSPGRRARHTSIARLVKPPSVGKANRELAEFDPLISPVRESKPTDESKDLLSLSPTTPSKKGLYQPADTTDLMKQQDKSPIKQCNLNTKIPLPRSAQQTNHNRLSRHLDKEDETLKPENILVAIDDQVLHPTTTTTTTTAAAATVTTTAATATTTTSSTATKLRKPEVIVPKSIKRLPSNPRSIPINYARRPSFPTGGSDILQDQLEKEREKSRRLSANLVSAKGLISQPDDLEEQAGGFSPLGINRSSSHDSRLDKIHDRLQCLVDVQSPTVSDDGHSEETAAIHYQREGDHVEAMSGRTALNRYRPYLSPYEKMEILRYSVVYCVGSHAKKHMASTDDAVQNYGYDDEKGDYKVVPKDHLNYRYEVIESLGKGSFGQVVKCKDHKLAQTDPDNCYVAVKIIRNKKRFHAQAQTEVRILEQLMKWDPKNRCYNVRMMDSFYFRDHLCISFECLSLNLYEILQQNSYQGFSMGLVKRFAYQILTSLKLLSEHNVIHCDLKPENILLKQPDRSGIRVIDFGSSCYTNEKVFTYIQSRFYRAPEVILGLDYGLPIDMWSTGCILAELYTGRPLFPGENEPDQLACIMQLLGVPKKDYLDRCTRKKQFFDMYDQPRKAINSKGKKRRPNTLTFTEALRRSTYDNFDKDFGDFISRCLTWEPEERMKPVEALNHPWVQAMKKQ